MNMSFKPATDKDTDRVLKLYKSQLGREFCPWTDDYPNLTEIKEDLANGLKGPMYGGLFILVDEDGTLLAAISADHNPDADALPFWQLKTDKCLEFSRLAVSIDYQNQGIAREIVFRAMDYLKENGIEVIRYMVNRLNLKALRSYEHLGFTKVGECNLYEQDFYCYEKKL